MEAFGDDSITPATLFRHFRAYPLIDKNLEIARHVIFPSFRDVQLKFHIFLDNLRII